MIVSHRHKFIFLRTEKTAGSSLTQALRGLLSPDDLRGGEKRPAWAKYSPIHHGALKLWFPDVFGLHVHATAAQARRVIGAKLFDSYYKFAIERNPWERQVSLYTHREWKKGNENTDFDRDMQSIWYRNTEYCKLNNWAIYAIGGEIVVDKMMRYETLDRDVAELYEKLGVTAPAQMPRLRAYSPNRPHYSNYYSEATRDLVASWYAREIDALGYQFDAAPQRVAVPI